MTKVKVGIVRGPFLNSWEMQNYLPIEKLKGVRTFFIGTSPSYFEFDHPRVIRTKMYRIPTPFGIKAIQPSLFPILKGIDIIHSVEAYSSLSLVTSLISQIHQKKFIFTQWETLPRKSRLRCISKRIIRTADKIHAVTERAKHCLVELGAEPDKVFVQHYGVNLDVFSPRTSPKYRSLLKLQDKKVISFIGRLVFEKGILYLLDAFKSLLKKYSDLSLIICGEGPLSNQCLKYAKTYKDNISLLGPLSYTEIPYLHASSDILCLPSIPTSVWEEQFGMVLIEAMASGKPVISTLSGAIPEIIIEGTGILVKPADVTALKNSIEYLISDTDVMRKMGLSGRRLAIAKFDAEKVAIKLHGVYKEVYQGTPILLD